MTVIATLSITPVHDGSVSTEIAAAIQALDEYDVEYEINPMGTVLEATDVREIFAAAAAAHQAIDADKVNTKLEIDHERDRDRDAAERVSALEDAVADEPADAASTDSETTTDDVEERDTVDASGHAPEDVEDDAQEDDVNIKGGDYKTDDTDKTEEGSISDRFYDDNDDTDDDDSTDEEN